MGFIYLNKWVEDKANSEWNIPPEIVGEIASKVESTGGKVITASIVLAFIFVIAGNFTWIAEIRGKRERENK
ncbi:MAG: hypothetical protein J7K58_01400 [Euryarchaeota archaeon]|nr:hypothetical protein [Euryarchaeota archaeon]